MNVPLIIAAHGTRVGEGVAQCEELAGLVAERLPGVPVTVGYVELAQPTITDALVASLADGGRRAVVVPLMLGTGGHVRSDIPQFIAEATARVPGSRVEYARHLGPEPRLIEAVEARLTEAAEEWVPGETTVVFVGRGALVPEANADHLRVARLLYERGGWADVESAFIKVTRPSLPEALDRAYAHGARRIVVMGHWLFAGRLKGWTREHAAEWQGAHPDAEVRVANVIGACAALADVVAERYRETLPVSEGGSPAYLAGLMLGGRDVLVVGGGKVASRRVSRLVESGARVRVVAPSVTRAVEALADAGRLTWLAREFDDADLDGTWYVMAATDSPEVNAKVAEGAELRHTFCVRADDARGGSAWTPATAEVRGVTVGVVGNREPRRTRDVRDAIVAALSEPPQSTQGA